MNWTLAQNKRHEGVGGWAGSTLKNREAVNSLWSLGSCVFEQHCFTLTQPLFTSIQVYKRYKKSARARWLGDSMIR